MSGPLPSWDNHLEQRLKLDCRLYRGDRPCSAGVQGVCPSDCGHYDPMGHRILIIKLGALGDVIRTAALLPGLKETWPQSHITWISRPGGVRMLANHPHIDRLLPFGAETICHIEHERFDLCLSLDKEPGPAALAMRVDARERRGVGLSPYGTAFPLNPECGHYFRLGLDDNLKFHHNDKSYQKLIYEALGMHYRGQRYRLYPDEYHTERAARLWATWGLESHQIVVGLNTGAGRVFANKSWSAEKWIELIKRLTQRHADWRVALLGGPEERELNAQIQAACPQAIDTGCEHGELEFAALVRRCSALVTGDTMAMHVAIALDVPCLVLFGPTCALEIDLYDRGERIMTDLTCGPCYRRHCAVSPSCMDSIGVERVVAGLERWVHQQAATTTHAAVPAEVSG